MNDEQYDSIKSELEQIRENCLYSAQAYFEAAKSAEFWGRFVVFIPACASAISGFMSALNKTPTWGAISAVTGAVAATASFLGATKKAADFQSSARSYTALRQKVRLQLGLLAKDDAWEEARDLLNSVNDAYIQIVSTDTPVPNRAFLIARKRIQQGLAS
ncbi:SLATT domain-containing protein [Streptomyces sp. NPDC048419]|uniref:SLATT domain-containing protein n=1 Tax=Streptomyces sp. NPDC048419 TaxID=3365547 RepID=UPI003714758F